MTHEIHFVTGKGGVGKSLVAAALALKKAQSGQRVLLVELGERSFYKDFFDLPEVRFQGTEFLPNLEIALWSGPEALRDYAKHLIKVESLVKLFFENQVSRSLVEIAPALSELAVLGKATSGPRKHGPPMPYDVIVIDAYSTGHFLALLRAPRGMAEAIRFGPMGEQSRSIDAALKDPSLCHVHVVTLPEEMPVTEAEELVQSLKNEFSMRPEVILNKWVEFPEQKLKGQDPFTEFARSTQERQSEMQTRLRAMGFGVRQVPLILDDQPRSLVEKLAESL